MITFYFSNARKLNPICRNVRGSVRIEKKAELIIGNNVAISSACIWVHEFVKIGNNVRIGGDCLIIDSDCHSLDIWIVVIMLVIKEIQKTRELS